MDNPNKKSVIVVGATGLLGGEICRQLVNGNKRVKALIRTTSDPGKVAELQQLGVQTVVGDIKNISSLENAFENVDAVISTVSSTLSRQEGDSIETVDQSGQLNVVEAAEKAGVNHFIFISFYKIALDFPLQTAKRAVENRLIQGKMKYTILQPTLFMEVWLSPALGFDFPNAKATVYGEGKNKLSWISLSDVASFAVACLDHPAAENAQYQLGGPDTLAPLEVIEIFERVSGQKFTINHVPIEALRGQNEAATDSLNKSFAALMISYAEGNEMNKESESVHPLRGTVSEYAKRVLS